MKAIIKRARTSDIKELNEISIESKMHWNYPQEWIEKWVEDLRLTESDFFSQRIFKLEVEPGSIAGFCSIQENAATYEVVHLWIRPQFMGKGYGKTLLHTGLQSVAICDKPIMVVADPNAESFYRKQGFRTIEMIESFPKGRYLPVMKKEKTKNY